MNLFGFKESLQHVLQQERGFFSVQKIPVFLFMPHHTSLPCVVLGTNVYEKHFDAITGMLDVHLITEDKSGQKIQSLKEELEKILGACAHIKHGDETFSFSWKLEKEKKIQSSQLCIVMQFFLSFNKDRLKAS